MHCRGHPDSWRSQMGEFSLTCTSCSANSMDIDLGEPRGVVVNDHLHCGDVQAPGDRVPSAPRSTREN